MVLIDQNDEEERKSCGLVKETNNILVPRSTLASIESLTFPLVQEIVILADFKCERCQKRVADIISRMHGETESVEMSVLEKKVTLTFTSTIPRELGVVPAAKAINYHTPTPKLALMRRLFCPSQSVLTRTIHKL